MSLRVDTAAVDGSHQVVESTEDGAVDLDGNRNSLLRKEVGHTCLYVLYFVLVLVLVLPLVGLS